MVLPVQASRHIIGNVHNRRLGTVTTAATATAGVAEVRGEGVSLTARELLNHVQDGLMVQSSIGADLRIVLRPVGEVVSTTIIGCLGTVDLNLNVFVIFSKSQNFHVRGNSTSLRIGADVLDQHLIAVGDTVAALVIVFLNRRTILPVIQVVVQVDRGIFGQFRLGCNGLIFLAFTLSSILPGNVHIVVLVISDGLIFNKVLNQIAQCSIFVRRLSRTRLI